MTTDADRLWPTLSAFARAQIAVQEASVECFLRLADFCEASGEPPPDVVAAFRKLARDTDAATNKALAAYEAGDRETFVEFAMEAFTDLSLQLVNGHWGERVVSPEARGPRRILPRKPGKEDPR